MQTIKLIKGNSWVTITTSDEQSYCLTGSNGSVRQCNSTEAYSVYRQLLQKGWK